MPSQTEPGELIEPHVRDELDRYVINRTRWVGSAVVFFLFGGGAVVWSVITDRAESIAREEVSALKSDVEELERKLRKDVEDSKFDRGRLIQIVSQATALEEKIMLLDKSAEGSREVLEKALEVNKSAGEAYAETILDNADLRAALISAIDGEASLQPPVGSIVAWLGISNPPGWHICNGDLIPEADERLKAALLGRYNKPGDPPGSVRLPNMGGLLLMGSANERSLSREVLGRARTEGAEGVDLNLHVHESPLMAKWGDNGIRLPNTHLLAVDKFSTRKPDEPQIVGPHFKHLREKVKVRHLLTDTVYLESDTENSDLNNHYHSFVPRHLQVNWIIRIR